MLSSFCICGTAAMTAAALRTCAKNQFYIFGEWCNSIPAVKSANTHVPSR